MMKNIFPFFILFSIRAFSQEHTLPDSAGIINAHVKSVKVYYNGTGNQHYFTEEYRYNKKGQCIYENKGNAYYYSNEYNENGELVKQTQRGMNGEFMSGCETDYYPDKNKFHIKIFNRNDTLSPENIYTYDEKGNLISQLNYYKGEMRSAIFNNYNSDGDLISSKDSVPFGRVTIRTKKNLEEVIQYDSSGKWKESWQFKYDSTGKLLASTLKHGKFADDRYTFTYNNYGKVTQFFLNGFPAPESKKNNWMKQWGYLLPRENSEDMHFPISDPVYTPQYVHTFKRDAKGNILTDEIAPAESWSNEKPVSYAYEYEYWK